MNGTSRGLNRVLLALVGLILLATGASLVALTVVPAVARRWQEWAAPQVVGLSSVAARTRLAAGGSWIWLVVAACLLVVVIVMVSWVANQGKGRTSILFQRAGTAQEDGAAGKVVLSSAVAEQSLKAALLQRGDLLGVSVTSYDFRGQPSVRVRVLPRQGVAPHEVAAEVASLVDALDALLGVQVPVLLSVGSGPRSRFTKAERVR